MRVCIHNFTIIVQITNIEYGVPNDDKQSAFCWFLIGYGQNEALHFCCISNISKLNTAQLLNVVLSIKVNKWIKHCIPIGKETTFQVKVAWARLRLITGLSWNNHHIPDSLLNITSAIFVFLMFALSDHSTKVCCALPHYSLCNLCFSSGKPILVWPLLLIWVCGKVFHCFKFTSGKIINEAKKLTGSC